MVEKVAAVATDEPEIAANPPQAAIVARPSPPRRWPTKVLAERNSSRLMPERDGELTHQQEHRDDAERVVGHGPHRGLADHFQRRLGADQIAEAGDADQSHRHADRHAQQHHHEQRDEAEDRDQIGTHHSTGCFLNSVSISGWNDRAARCAARSTARPRNRRATPPRRTARSADAGRRSRYCRGRC